MINISVILCAIAGFFGLFALIKWFCILKPNVHTNMLNAIPIIITTVAWLSAAVVFYQTEAYNSPIDITRIAMIIGWIWLIYRIRIYRDTNRQKDKTIKALSDTIKNLTAN